LQCLRIAGVVSRCRFDVGEAGSGGDNCLIVFWKLVEFRLVDQEMEGGATLPPAGVVIKFNNFVETKLFVIVGANPLRSVDCALFQRRIDVATGDLLRDGAKLAKRLAGPATDAHLNTFEVCRILELLVEPAAHLRAGIAHGQTAHIELLAEVVDQTLAFALIEPGILLARIESEWRRTEQRPGRILADVVVLGAVAQFDGAILDSVKRLQTRHDLTRGKVLNLKLAVRCLGNILGESFTSAVERVEGFWPTRRQSPFDGRAGLCDRRLGDRGDGGAGAKSGKKL